MVNLGRREGMGLHVQKSLRGMLTSTVSRVDDCGLGMKRRRYTRLGNVLGSELGSTRLRMAKNQYIRVALDATHRILEGLSLLGGGSTFLDGNHLSSQSAEGSVERGGSTSGGLEEHVGHNAVLGLRTPKMKKTFRTSHPPFFATSSFIRVATVSTSSTFCFVTVSTSSTFCFVKSFTEITFLPFQAE